MNIATTTLPPSLPCELKLLQDARESGYENYAGVYFLPTQNWMINEILKDHDRNTPNKFEFCLIKTRGNGYHLWRRKRRETV